MRKKRGEVKKRLEEEKEKREKLLPPQWLDCDLRKIDVTVLGQFDVIMADPPWDSEWLPEYITNLMTHC